MTDSCSSSEKDSGLKKESFLLDLIFVSVLFNSDTAILLEVKEVLAVLIVVLVVLSLLLVLVVKASI